MLLFLCPDCGSWHIFQSFSEMIKLSGGLGIIACVNGCGIMIQVLPRDKLVAVSAVSMERVKEKVMNGIRERRLL